MKRWALIVFVLGVVLFGIFSVQTVNAQNANVAQRIIGTWVDNDGGTWVFDANGTLKVGRLESKFGVTDTQLVYIVKDGPFAGLNVFDISISSDGNTLIMEGRYYLMTNARTGTYSITRDRYWLTKK